MDQHDKDEINQVLDHQAPKWVNYLIGGFFAGVSLISSCNIIGGSEVGVVTRLGKYDRLIEPGLNFVAPFIESVDKIDVNKVYRLEVGFKTIDQGPPAIYEDRPEEATMLTGDENIVVSEFIVQYRIKDAKDYNFNVRNVETTLKEASEAVHRQIIGDNGIDEALTTGKTEIQNKTREKLQEVVDLYKMGIKIVNVQLQNVDAPDPVKSYFKDVASAKEDMSKYVNQARGYQNEIIPRVRGRAAELIQQAEAYKAQRVNKALGDAKRFTEILREYEKAPQITEERLYIETMSEIYPNLEKIIIEDNGILKFLDLEGRAKDNK